VVEDAPPPHPVSWTVRSRLDPHRSIEVVEQLWMRARALGAAELGLLPEQTTCTLTDPEHEGCE
jgi:hypothetical protein